MRTRLALPVLAADVTEPDPVDVPALRRWFDENRKEGDDQYGHHQVPEVVKHYGLRVRSNESPRRVGGPLGCAAHSEGQFCCLDYFYDTIEGLVTPVDRPAMVQRVVDVLAPERSVGCGPEHDDVRFPIFEWGHETTPTLEEIRELALDIVKQLFPPEQVVVAGLVITP